MRPSQDRIGVLQQLFDEFNEDEFDGKLTQIRLLIKRNCHRDGYYEFKSQTRNGDKWMPCREQLHKATITISDGCWEEDSVRGTLLHEMMHQYQCEVLDEAPHHTKFFNDWAKKLERKYKFTVR